MSGGVSAAVKSPAIIFVVAAAENGVIGRDGGLPWKLKSDMARFKALTLNKPVVMGRKTFVSLPKPLVHRTNIVITRDTSFAARGAIVAATIERALDVALGDALRRGANEIAVIGGAEIFNQLLGRADRVELTRVHEQTKGDVIFADLPPKEWREAAREDHAKGAGDDAAYTYLTYKRIAA
jgi:dihydrofolate reductase